MGLKQRDDTHIYGDFPHIGYNAGPCMGSACSRSPFHKFPSLLGSSS